MVRSCFTFTLCSWLLLTGLSACRPAQSKTKNLPFVSAKVESLQAISDPDSPSVSFSLGQFSSELSHYVCQLGAGQAFKCSSPVDLSSLLELGKQETFSVLPVSTSGARGQSASVEVARFYRPHGLSHYATSAFRQADGGVVVGGAFSHLSPEISHAIVRYSATGSVDRSFVVRGSGFNDAVYAIARQSSGKIIVTGLFTSYDGTPVGRIARLFPDGRLDTSFNEGGSGFNGAGFFGTLFIDSQDRIITAGSFTIYNDVNVARLIRLNADGSHDTSFVDVDEGFAASSTALVVGGMADGPYWLTQSSMTSFNGTSRIGAVKIASNGALDAFSIGGSGFTPANASMSGAVDVGGGAVVISGNFTAINGTSVGRIARIASNGSLDTSFNSGGSGFDGAVSIRSVSGAKFLAVGAFNSYNGTTVGKIARLNADGSRDTSFNTGGTGFDAAASLADRIDIVDNKIYIALNSSSSTYNGVAVCAVVRLSIDGSLDTSFPCIERGSINDSLRTIKVMPDGSFFLSSYIQTVKQVSEADRIGRIVRITTEGKKDPNFNSGGTGFDDEVSTISGNPLDDSLYVGGIFTKYNGTSVPRLVKLDVNGVRDTSFDPGTGPAAAPRSSILTSDGLYVGGEFTTYNGAAATRIARVNPNTGALDSGFDSATGANGTVSVLAEGPSASLYLGGAFSQYKGVAASRLVRVSANGARDATFVVGTGFDANVRTLLPVDDGIIVGGLFTTYNGAAAMRIVKLNLDGSVDSNFGSGMSTGFDGGVSFIKQDGTGFLVSGAFTHYKGLPVAGWARIKSDGTLDTSYRSGKVGARAFRDSVSPSRGAVFMESLANGEWLVGFGWATLFLDVPMNYLAIVDSEGNVSNNVLVGN